MGDRYVLVCEDEAQRLLVYRWLLAAGVNAREVVPPKFPAGKGAGWTFVLREYPVQVQEHRRKANAHACKLIVVIDADALTTQERIQQLDESLVKNGLERRAPGERICILVPRRAVETWLHYLHGNPVDESTDYKREIHDLPDACRTAGVALHNWFRTASQVVGAPSALAAAVPEVQRISSAAIRLV